METSEAKQSAYEDRRRVAHDVRNSLSVIYSYAQLLEMSLGELKLKKDSKLAQTMVEEIRKLNILIAHMLNSAASAGSPSAKSTRGIISA